MWLKNELRYVPIFMLSPCLCQVRQDFYETLNLVPWVPTYYIMYIQGGLCFFKRRFGFKLTA